ncbi:hypothetical protein QFC22_004970 [Naganishia vaughanmartiniae]|uniref:Uncharacterized protein n=1 Tax=Naganishia vaughanmartiniae TaxID=1424756 RepID=A0ACC2WXG7_9TREE|nr:hypothetical protein QFC22_004970 [Naganishia vaughanmartiniae]
MVDFLSDRAEAQLLPRADNNYRESPYGYIPSSGVCITAIVLFAVSTAVHAAQAIYYSIQRRRRSRAIATIAPTDGDVDVASGQVVSNVWTRQPSYWWILATLVPGGLLEIVGWAGSLILAPCFFSAFDYTLLGLCIKHLGEDYSLLNSKWYMILFVIADVISLVIQAVGGGRAAVQSQNYEDTTTSTNIMVAGIVFQLAAIVVFVILGADFIFRLASNKPYVRRARTVQAEKSEKAGEVEPHLRSGMTTAEEQNERKRWMVLLATVFFSALMIVMRGVYRTIELLQGECKRVFSDYRKAHHRYLRIDNQAGPVTSLPMKSTSMFWISCP